MNRKFLANPAIRALYQNLPVEAAVTDSEFLDLVDANILLKTYARHRKNPPTWMRYEELLMLARIAEMLGVAASADVIAMARKGVPFADHRLRHLSLGQSFALSDTEVHRTIKEYRKTARRIYMFDSDQSFDYLNPELEQELPPDEKLTLKQIIAASEWNKVKASMQFDRFPRISVFLTHHSLTQRASFSDESIEQLIGNIQIGEHSLTLVNDQRQLVHRIYRGVFDDAVAVSIFDRDAMVVFPRNRNAVRLYEASTGPEQTELIRDSIRTLIHMRRFRTHPPVGSTIVEFLQCLLSYPQFNSGAGFDGCNTTDSPNSTPRTEERQ